MEEWKTLMGLESYLANHFFHDSIEIQQILEQSFKNDLSVRNISRTGDISTDVKIYYNWEDTEGLSSPMTRTMSVAARNREDFLKTISLYCDYQTCTFNRYEMENIFCLKPIIEYRLEVMQSRKLKEFNNNLMADCGDNTNNYPNSVCGTEYFKPLNIFLEAETALGFKIPRVLKNILKASGYANEFLISSMSELTIQEIEEFSRVDLPLIIKECDYKYYYGIYYENPHLFRFLPGHKQILKLLIRYFEENINARTTISTPSLENPKTSAQCEIDYELSQQRVVDQTEENSKLKKKIISWATNKMNPLTSTKLWENLDNIVVETQILGVDEMYCIVTCFCKAQYRIFRRPLNASIKKLWVLSDFYCHLLQEHFHHQQVPE
ncbi:hypothetical protein FQA39_LY01488 [Lamprigera yunnana]|nr:hypothetical protein FQA39_LY01488 [Lamprigera yunnana]